MNFFPCLTGLDAQRTMARLPGISFSILQFTLHPACVLIRPIRVRPRQSSRQTRSMTMLSAPWRTAPVPSTNCDSNCAAAPPRWKIIEPVIQRLLELGYLNDQRFAGMYATIKGGNDGFGLVRVLSRSRARRHRPETAGRGVSQVFGDKTKGNGECLHGGGGCPRSSPVRDAGD